MRELAVVVNNSNESVTPFQMLDAIKMAGFKNVFLQWYNREDMEVSQEEQLFYARKIGLNVVFCHLRYRRINEIWDTELEETQVNEVVDGYINDLKVCKENGIDLVIMHLTSKSTAPMYNEK